MKKVVIIGAGFSGMCSAYFLNQSGYQVEVFEKEKKPGGLIKTIETPFGKVEASANGIINSRLFEKIASEINLKLVSTLKSSRKRFIYRGHPRRWPLGIFESALLVWKFIRAKNRRPLESETVAQWGRRVLGSKATHYILSPALQGIYAGDIKALSATLILNRFFIKKTKNKKPILKGLVAPESGMGQFFINMEEYLKNHGVIFRYGTEVDLSQREDDVITVVATSAAACANILKGISKPFFKILSSIEMLSLIKSTVFYEAPSKKVRGFGVLFPQGQGIESLGVLFNNHIFQATAISDSYILGGSLNPGVSTLSDGAIKDLIDRDRDIAFNDSSKPKGLFIQRWPKALPHYTIALEENLKALRPEKELLESKGIFIVGNYLGGIGLSRILDLTSQLPCQINEHYKNE